MRVTRLTPLGPAGVALVAVRGAGADALLAGSFARRSGRAALPRPGEAVVGEVRDAQGVALDHVLLVRAGPDEVVIGCHGGPAVVASVLAALRRAGAEVDPAAGGADAVGEGEEDRVRVEAEAALPACSTELGCQVLLRQLGGALRDEARAIRAFVPDDPAGARARVERLLGTTRLGEALLQPPAVVLVGLPNAGKSSLVNALAGHERVLVAAEAGTTRDAVDVPAELDGVPVRLVDTAGRRATPDPVEAEGVARAERAAIGAACRLLVVAADAPLDGPLELAATLAAPCVVALSKCDLLGEGERDLRLARCRADGQTAIPTSARSGAGLDALREALRDRLVGRRLPLDAAVVFTPRQRELLRGAARALEAGARVRAERLLGALAG